MICVLFGEVIDPRDFGIRSRYRRASIGRIPQAAHRFRMSPNVFGNCALLDHAGIGNERPAEFLRRANRCVIAVNRGEHTGRWTGECGFREQSASAAQGTRDAVEAGTGTCCSHDRDIG